MTTKQLAVLLVFALLLVGYLEYRNAPVEKVILENPQIGFVRPLQCDAIVSQRGAGEPFVSRCYIRSSSR